MFARLYAKTGKMAGASYEFVTEAIIGHGPECNLVIKSGVLSAKHARIFFDDHKGSYFLEDFKSHNGTLLDGKPVTGKVKLERKHVIMFAGTFAFIFQIEQGEAANPLAPPPTDIPAEREAPPRPINLEANRHPHAAEEPAHHEPVEGFSGQRQQHTVFDDVQDDVPAPVPEEEPPAPPPAEPAKAARDRDAAPTMLVDDAQFAELFTAHPKFMVELISVRGEKHAIHLKEGENTVGRITGSDILIDDASISRNHAVVIVRAGKVTIRDLQSKNGTFVEEKKIVVDTEVEPDTPLRFGLVKASVIAQTHAS
jgi:pSer/pThr/pTyr-binding forkhead associated (FHA) protein